jgi:predicted TIM-barrel fold metal-dependent hydrolase
MAKQPETGALLLEEFSPRSTLVVEEHIVERPRFPAVDAHNHLGFRTDSFGNPVSGEGTGWVGDVNELVETMDRCDIRTIVNLSGAWGADLKRLLEQYEERHPGRFVTFANVDWRRAGERGFGEWAAKQLEESVRAGARGLKVFKGLGLQARNAAGKLLSPDDEWLDPLWATAGELKVPVLIHVADPVAFFQPLDRYNEAYLTLQRWPEWHFYGADFPTFQELIDAGIRLMGRHPRTTFITPHTGWYSENLGFVGGQMLDKLPNMVIDFSARISILGHQPHTARKFFIRYHDRILFGTDGAPTAQVYQTYFRFLETDDDAFEAHPGRASSRIYGLNLPDDVLKKVYYENAVRVIPGIRIE